jgi:hypothetical protein
VTTPAQLAAARPLPDLWAALDTHTGRARDLIIAAIRIHLDRLWRPFD